MSTVVPDAGGVVVISQVRPLNDQGNGPEEGETGDASANMPKAVLAFYRGEPEVLGTTQIFAGIVLISFDIVMTIAIANTFNNVGFLVYSGAPLWSGILFIVSGSLSVAASVKPTVGKVKSSLVMNIITSLAAFCGMIMATMEVSFLSTFTPYILRESYCSYYKSDSQCLGIFSSLDVYYGFLSFNLILFVLIFCISISTSVFGCRTVCRSSFQEISVVIYQTTSSVVSDTTRDVPPDSTAAFSSTSMTQT
ncbi:membrane-spanning 4-domains subfamily A member 4A-like [Phyllobates terribilis]|uniref:membrane-spanning 4-domains subfamily A member 4A-like n=1 Tax=Phyllobates terribilis TaxID=111132 RepID=UPI003CCB085D